GRAEARAADGADIGNAGRQSDTTVETARVGLSEIQFARAVACLHQLGPRPLYEFLVDLAAARMIRTEVEVELERHLGRLDPEFLRALDSDYFPASSLDVVAPGDG